MAVGVALSRRALIQDVWPDKVLYAAVLLLLAGALGSFSSLAFMLVDTNFGSRFPQWLTYYPFELSLGLSVAVVALALVAIRRRSLPWAFAGCVVGVAAQGLLGVGSILSIIAGIFVVFSRLEGEHENPISRRLTARMWPDKSLAASLLVLALGVTTILWGAGLAFTSIAFEPYFGEVELFGILTMVVGLFALVASWRLYVQRSPLLGVAACLLASATLSVYVVGPILAAAGLVLILLAWKEDEFAIAAKA